MKDRYIYSTMSNNVDYVDYRIEKDLNIPVRTVTILGGANVINKALVTPLGVVTKVTEDELEFLRKNSVFQDHVKAGFIKVSDAKVDPEVVVPDMKGRDQSAQLVPGDFQNSTAKPMEGKPERRFG